MQIEKHINKFTNKYNIMEFRRKLYKRGSSFETTIPKPILFALDLKKKHNVVFSYDSKANRWNISFEEEDFEEGKRDKNARR